VRRGGIGTWLVLGAVALVSALCVVLVAWTLGGEEEAARPRAGLPTEPVPVEGPVARPSGPASRPAEIEARSALTSQIVLFGDTVTADVDVVLDRDRVDPDSVRLGVDFSPWEVVGTPRRSRRDAGSMTHLRTTYVLRCLTSPCVPSGQVAPIRFGPARVAYEGAEDRPAGASGGPAAGAPGESFRVPWPVLTLYSRFASGSFDGRETLLAPWRADLVTLPAASYRVAPGLAVALLGGLGLLFACLGAALVYRAWPRREYVPPPEPVAPPPPELSPLEQALVLLEDAARADGVEDRRRALELVSLALDEHGDEGLARSARILAWSESVPEVDDTTGLAVRVRAALDLEQAEADPEENGRVV
jgi:hypothetical protein